MRRSLPVLRASQEYVETYKGWPDSPNYCFCYPQHRHNSSENRTTVNMLPLQVAIFGLIHACTAVPTALGTSHLKRDSCPKDLPAQPDFEFPHLIVPISKLHPEVANPNTYFPRITPSDLGTVFNFVILHGGDQACELGFYFPRQDQLQTSSYTFAGPGNFTVRINQPGSGAEDGVTTWSNQPAPGPYDGFPKTMKMEPGNYYSLFEGACLAGLWSITISSPDSSFSWFQDYNPCPIGPYVTYEGPLSNPGAE